MSVAPPWAHSRAKSARSWPPERSGSTMALRRRSTDTTKLPASRYPGARPQARAVEPVERVDDPAGEAARRARALGGDFAGDAERDQCGDGRQIAIAFD